jgi:hypothetical protein
MRRIINIAISLFLLLHFGQLQGQQVIDTFLIKDLTDKWVQAKQDYHLHEDAEYYYYMVEKDMFDVDWDIVDGEIVYTKIEQNEFRYEVQGETIEANSLPGKTDTLGGGYVLLLKFTKDFELVDYAILKNVISGKQITNNELKVSDGKIYLTKWTNLNYPVVVNNREFPTGIDTNAYETMNSLIVLDEEMEAVSVDYFPGVGLIDFVANKNNEAVLAFQIPDNSQNEVVIAGDTIKNNLFDGSSYEFSQENVIVCNYGYLTDSLVWWELISNDLGVRVKEMIDGPDNQVYLHLTAASPYVYIGPEGSETDSVAVFGAAVDWVPQKRDHLVMIFDKNGKYQNSITIPEGIYDTWYNCEIDADGSVYVSATYYDDSLQVRDTLFRNEYMINHPSKNSHRSGILKFTPGGIFEWGYYPAGDYSENSIYEMKIQNGGLYVMASLYGDYMYIGDSIIYVDEDNFVKQPLFRISKDGRRIDILFNSDAPLDAIIDLKEINTDTLVMVPFLAPDNRIYNYQWNVDSGLGILKVDFSKKTVSNNRTVLKEFPGAKIYPNPVHAGSNLRLEFKENVNVKSVVIYDGNGRSVADTDHAAIQTMKVKIPEVPPGQYYIKCTLEDGIFFKPLVVQ